MRQRTYRIKIKQNTSSGSSTSTSVKESSSDSEDEEEVDEGTTEETTSVSTTGIRPEFQEAMDAYESFMNEYCEFMAKYAASDNPTSLLTEYMDFLNRYAEAVEKFDAVGDEDMSDEEFELYLDVSNRVAKKLLDISVSI